jgi:hypothetical protein
MSISYLQALDELALLTKDGRLASPDELRALANRVSSFSSGSTTVLYSGELADGTKAGAVVEAMIAKPRNLRVRKPQGQRHLVF